MSGLRQAQKDATRSALHRAALELALERGADSVTADDVAARVGVSTRTFFNYFATKQDALVGADPGLPDRVAETLRQTPPGLTCRKGVQAALLTHLGYITADLPAWQLRKALARHAPNLGLAMGALGRQLEVALLTAALERWGGTEGDLEVAVDVLASLASARAALWLHERLGSEGDLRAALERAFAALEGTGTD